MKFLCDNAQCKQDKTLTRTIGHYSTHHKEKDKQTILQMRTAEVTVNLAAFFVPEIINKTFTRLHHRVAMLYTSKLTVRGIPNRNLSEIHVNCQKRFHAKC